MKIIYTINQLKKLLIEFFTLL